MRWSAVDATAAIGVRRGRPFDGVEGRDASSEGEGQKGEGDKSVVKIFLHGNGALEARGSAAGATAIGVRRGRLFDGAECHDATSDGACLKGDGE